MLDKSIPYKDLIMKWDGNRQCLLPVCVPPGYRLRTWREGDQKNWARIQKEAGEFGDMTVSYRITCNNGNQRTLINP